MVRYGACLWDCVAGLEQEVSDCVLVAVLCVRRSADICVVWCDVSRCGVVVVVVILMVWYGMVRGCGTAWLGWNRGYVTVFEWSYCVWRCADIRVVLV